MCRKDGEDGEDAGTETTRAKGCHLERSAGAELQALEPLRWSRPARPWSPIVSQKTFLRPALRVQVAHLPLRSLQRFPIDARLIVQTRPGITSVAPEPEYQRDDRGQRHQQCPYRSSDQRHRSSLTPFAVL
jgi:hypothetical protein